MTQVTLRFNNFCFVDPKIAHKGLELADYTKIVKWSMEPILRTIANVKKKSGSFEVFSFGWYLLYPTLVLPSSSMLTPTSAPIIITIVQQWMFQERMGGRKKPLVNNISNYECKHYESLLSYALLQELCSIGKQRKSTISFQRSALCNEGKKSTLSGTCIVATIKQK